MNQYKLGQLGKVWSMMSRHPEVLLINIVRVVISSQLPGLFLGSEKQWYFNQKPIKIGWVCRGGCVLKKGDMNLRTRWQKPPRPPEPIFWELRKMYNELYL